MATTTSSPDSMLPFKKRERFLEARFDADAVVDSSSTPPERNSISSGSGSGGSFWFEKKRREEAADLFSCQHLQQIAADMGMPPLALYLSKRITGTDADHNAHRYQLTSKDIRSVQALQDLKRRAIATGRRRPESSSSASSSSSSSPPPPQPAVAVKVLDKHGGAYDMSFSHNSSTDYCRIIGRDWTRFLRNTAMREGQTMLLYGSHNGRGDHLFALCNI